VNYLFVYTLVVKNLLIKFKKTIFEISVSNINLKFLNKRKILFYGGLNRIQYFYINISIFIKIYENPIIQRIKANFNFH